MRGCVLRAGRAAAFVRLHPRIAHDQRHADGFLIRIPLIRQAVLSVKVAVYGASGKKLKKFGVSYSFSALWNAETFVNLKNIAYRSKTSRRDST